MLTLVYSQGYDIKPIDYKGLLTLPWETNCAMFVLLGGGDVRDSHSPTAIPTTPIHSITGDGDSEAQKKSKNSIRKRLLDYITKGGQYLEICSHGGASLVFEQGRPLVFASGAAGERLYVVSNGRGERNGWTFCGDDVGMQGTGKAVGAVASVQFTQGAGLRLSGLRAQFCSRGGKGFTIDKQLVDEDDDDGDCGFGTATGTGKRLAGGPLVVLADWVTEGVAPGSTESTSVSGSTAGQDTKSAPPSAPAILLAGLGTGTMLLSRVHFASRPGGVSNGPSEAIEERDAAIARALFGLLLPIPATKGEAQATAIQAGVDDQVSCVWELFTPSVGLPDAPLAYAALSRASPTPIKHHGQEGNPGPLENLISQAAREAQAAVLYAPVVTSTQALLLDNPGLLKGLFSALRQGEGGSTRCTPLYFLADHQVKGRGRGSNRWISYSGCLQTTACFFLDNHDQGGDQPQGACKGGKRLPLVMMQYLASIAIVRARREFLSSASWAEKRHVLGLEDPSTAVADQHHGDREWRIKWPNDVLELPGLGGEGGTHREFVGPKKVAGTLVNITNLRVPFA